MQVYHPRYCICSKGEMRVLTGLARLVEFLFLSEITSFQRFVELPKAGVGQGMANLISVMLGMFSY